MAIYWVGKHSWLEYIEYQRSSHILGIHKSPILDTDFLFLSTEDQCNQDILHSWETYEEPFSVRRPLQWKLSNLQVPHLYNQCSSQKSARGRNELPQGRRAKSHVTKEDGNLPTPLRKYAYRFLVNFTTSIVPMLSPSPTATLQNSGNYHQRQPRNLHPVWAQHSQISGPTWHSHSQKPRVWYLQLSCQTFQSLLFTGIISDDWRQVLAT